MDKTEQEALLQSFPKLTFRSGEKILKYNTGHSGAIVFAQMFDVKDIIGSSQPYVVKICECRWVGNELEFFARGAAKSLQHLIAWYFDATPTPTPCPDQTKVAIAYTIAGDTLLNHIVPLSTHFDKRGSLIPKEKFIQQIEYLASELVDWHIKVGHTSSIVVRTPNKALCEMLGWRAEDINLRLKEELPDWKQEPEELFFHEQAIWNPISHLKEDTWSWTTYNPPLPVGHIHGDLHTGNILCLTQQDNALPSIIDFEHTTPEGVIFFDFAYLEYDILQNIFHEHVDDSSYFNQWDDLLKHTMSTIIPSPLPKDTPFSESVRKAWELIMPIRKQVDRLLKDVQEKQPAMAELFEVAWWFATIAVGLNYARKEDLDQRRPPQERKAALFYAHFGLKKLREVLPSITGHRPRPASSIVVPTRSKEPDVAPSTEEAQLERYLRILRHTIPDKVDLPTLPDTPTSMPAVQLTQVFVQPRVTSDPLLSANPSHPDYHTFYGNPKPPKRSWQEQQHPDLKVETLATALGKDENSRLVILGEAGTGKTTLLRYLLLKIINDNAKFADDFPQLAKLLPVYIDFTEYANAIGATTFEDFLTEHFNNHYPGCAPLLLGKAKSGSTLFLFDGLDAIHDDGKRAAIAQLIDTSSRVPSSPYRNNRYIVTSRIISYRGGTELSDYPTLTLMPFDDPQIKLCIEGWCKAYRDLGYEKADHTPISQRLDRDRSIYELATHPLFLAMLVTMHLQRNEPHFWRILYFQRCINVLFHQHWLIAKDPTLSPKVAEALRKKLGTLSLWIHNHPFTRSFTFAEVFDLPSQNSPNDSSENQIEKRAEVLIERLIERHNQAYVFLFYPFQEYLAAEALAKQTNLGGSIKEHLYTPYWRELLRLTVSIFISQKRDKGYRSKNSPEIKALINQICPSSKDIEHPLQSHYNLLFAGQCLVDNAVNGYDELEEKVIKDIVQEEYLGPSDWLRSTFSQVLRDWSGTRGAERARQTLVKVLEHPEGFAISENTWDQVVANEYHELCLQKEQEQKDIRRLHITTLLYYLNEKEYIITKIDVIIQDDLNSSIHKVRETAATALGILGQDGTHVQKVKDALRASFKDPIWQVRVAAAKAFGLLATIDVGISNDLHNILSQGTEFTPEKEMTIMALAQANHIADNVHQIIISYLCKSFGLDNTPSPNSNAAVNLPNNPLISRTFLISAGQLARRQPEDISKYRVQVLDLLMNAIADEDPSIRHAAAIALGCLGKEYWMGEAAQKRIINALLTANADIYFPVIETANKALEHLGHYPLLARKLLS
jgi:hypothetical protein